MDRDEVALILGIAPDDVRIIPTACGGGFGGKLDLGVHALIALAAWRTGRPVPRRLDAPGIDGREPEAPSGPDHGDRRRRRRRPPHRATASTATSTPAPTPRGARPSPTACRSTRWARTRCDAVLATTPRRLHEQPARRRLPRLRRAPGGDRPRGADGRARGAARAWIALEFRLANALRAGSTDRRAASASTPAPACPPASRRCGRTGSALRADAAAHNARDAAAGAPTRRGVGHRGHVVRHRQHRAGQPVDDRDGRDRATAGVVLFCGAVDIGQGASTVLVQIAADALGVPAGVVELVSGDTDRTADAGKSSASRQTFVSGNAARLAGEDLRRQILLLAEVGADATIAFDGRATDRHRRERPVGDAIELAELPPVPVDRRRDRVRARRPRALSTRRRRRSTRTARACRTRPMPSGRRSPRSRSIPELGTVKVRRIVAAHDVGRAINPTQVEGQIHGGIAQGLGFALMEAYVPGRTENLHDYLIPTVGDMPEIECLLIEDAEPSGPYGAKGVGEPALDPDGPRDPRRDPRCCRRANHQLPATPDRVRAAMTATRTKTP